MPVVCDHAPSCCTFNFFRQRSRSMNAATRMRSAFARHPAIAARQKIPGGTRARSLEGLLSNKSGSPRSSVAGDGSRQPRSLQWRFGNRVRSASPLHRVLSVGRRSFGNMEREVADARRMLRNPDGSWRGMRSTDAAAGGGRMIPGSSLHAAIEVYAVQVGASVDTV